MSEFNGSRRANAIMRTARSNSSSVDAAGLPFSKGMRIRAKQLKELAPLYARVTDSVMARGCTLLQSELRPGECCVLCSVCRARVHGCGCGGLRRPMWLDTGPVESNERAIICDVNSLLSDLLVLYLLV